MPLSPGDTLGPYQIRAELGHGGMGVVYTAQDPRLKRQVAIKLLPPELSRDAPAKQRFWQEAQAASALDHPNICTIHEIDETDDGRLYLVMAHYEGETLKDRIETGPVPLDDAIDIATQIGQGLAEAHAAGIVHRDVKPANLLLTKNGTVKILDFGIAKLAGAEGVTQTGTTVGTVAYMSPEQARGEGVDHRTDIWSLGVVLYEMLSGQPPFQGENLLSISGSIQQDPPPALAGDSSPLSRVVIRALHKSPSQRYLAVADLLTDLRSARGPDTQASRQADVPSIAVLPFADMSPARDQDYFCEGMAEELINALVGLRGLRVSARTSSFKFKGQALDATEIGTQLKVSAILEGSVRTAGNRLRVTAQLINVSDGFHLWSERYDRDLDDVFAVQDEIARVVVDTLKIEMLGDEAAAPLVAPPTDNLKAYNLCLKGRHDLQTLTSAGITRSLDYFTQALAADPRYAQAHAGVSLAYATLGDLSFAAPRETMPKAADAARTALALDPRVADAHLALATVLDDYEWNWPEAERSYQRALALNPGDALARAYYAGMLLKAGRVDDAIVEAERSVEYDPSSHVALGLLVWAYTVANRLDHAVRRARHAVALDDGEMFGHLALGVALAAQGDLPGAVAAYRDARSRAPGEPLAEAYLGWAYGLVGERRQAEAVRDALERRREQTYTSATLIAQVHLGLGDHDKAFEWISTALDERDNNLTTVSWLPAFAALRTDSRYDTLQRRMRAPADPTDDASPKGR